MPHGDALTEKQQRRRRNIEPITSFGELITMDYVIANFLIQTVLVGEKALLVVPHLAMGL